jgi:hypothetical protein
MEPADIAKVAVLMASLPPEVNLYEATILPNHSRSFISRGVRSYRAPPSSNLRSRMSPSVV